MKNLFLVLSFILISVSTYSQDDFSGWWQSKTSKYITMIYAGSYGVSAVVNYSPSTDNTIHEEIIKRNSKKNTAGLISFLVFFGIEGLLDWLGYIKFDRRDRKKKW